MAEAAKAKAALQDLGRAAQAEGDVESQSALKSAAAHRVDTAEIDAERRALEQLAAAAKLAQTWTEWGGRNSPEAHLADMSRELELTTQINRQEWLGFSTPQQAYSWRQTELNLQRQLNIAGWQGYQTADQYLAYLAKERSGLADLVTVLMRRMEAYRDLTGAALAFADATRGTHASLGQLGENIDLTGISQFNAALVNLPDTVSTTLAIDDSGALAELARYEALLRGVPRDVSTHDVLRAGYSLGAAPVAAAMPQSEQIDVSYAGPWAEQYAAILAEVAALSRAQAEIPVHFDLPPEAEVAAFVQSLQDQLSPVTETAQLVTQGGGAGGGGGPPPYDDRTDDPDGPLRRWLATLSSGKPDAGMPADSAEPPDDVAKKWEQLGSAEKDVADDAQAAIAKLTTLSAAASSSADAAKYAYTAQMLQATVQKSVGTSAEDTVAQLAMQAAAARTSADAAKFAAAAQQALRNALAGSPAPAVTAAAALKQTAAAADDAGQTAHRTYGYWGLLTRQLTLWGGFFGSAEMVGQIAAWHVAMDGVIEVLALWIPAIVTATAALTAWGVAAYKSGRQVYEQMKNVLTVSTALGTTVAPLKGGFQQLADSVRPQVYQLFGDALDAMNTKGGTFNELIQQTGRYLDQFAAKIVVSMQSGGDGMKKFLETGEEDLALIGKGFDSLGQILMKFLQATALTHIAEDLAAIGDAVLGLVAQIQKIPTPVLAAVLGLHGLLLWGGLMATVLTKVGLGIDMLIGKIGPLNGIAYKVASGLNASTEQLTKLAAAAPAVSKVSDVLGSATSDLAQFTVNADKTGMSVRELATQTSTGADWFAKYGTGLDKAGQDAVALAIATGGTEAQIAKVASASTAAATDAGFFGSALAKLGGLSGLATGGLFALAAAAAVFAAVVLTAKDNTQKWIDSVNSGLAQASVMSAIGKNIGDLASVTDQLSHSQGLNAQAVHELTGEQTALTTNLTNALPHVSEISKAYGVSMVGALELLNTAGVTTSQLFSGQNKIWDIARQEVQGMVDGYKAMGQQTGAIGSDLNAMLVSESQQVTAMTNLNKAWDDWTQIVSGTPSQFTGLFTLLDKWTTDSKVAGASMTGLTKPAQALQGDFEQTFGQVEKLFDAFRLDQAAGASGNFAKFVKEAVAVLIPLAGNSKAAIAQVSALAQEAGGPATTNLTALAKWAGNTKDPLEQLYKDSNNAAVGASNLSADAAKLSDTLQQDLNPAMAQAAFAALGGQNTLNAFAGDLAKFGPDSQKTVGAGARVADMFLSIDKNSNQAKAQFVGWAESMGLSKKQADQLWDSAYKLTNAHYKVTLQDNIADTQKDLHRLETQLSQTTDPAKRRGIELQIKVDESKLAKLKDDLSGAGKATDQIRDGLETAADKSGEVTKNLGYWQQVMNGDKLRENMREIATWFGTTMPNAFISFGHFMAGSWDQSYQGFMRGLGSPVARFFDSYLPASAGDSVRFIAGSWDKTYQGFMRSFGSPVSNFFTRSIPAFFSGSVSQSAQSWDKSYQGFMRGFGSPVAGFFTHTIPGWWGIVSSESSQAWNSVSAGFSRYVSQPLANFFTKTVPGWWNILGSEASQTWGAVWSAFSRDVLQPLANFFSRTLPGQLGTVNHEFAGLWGSAWSAFSHSLLSPVNHFFSSSMPGWLTSLGRDFANLWGTVWHDFSSSVMGPMGRWFSQALPSSIRNGFRDSINWVIDNVINKVINFIDNDILKHLPGSLHISTIGNVAHGGPIGAANGGPFPIVPPGSIPGPSAVDGTRLMAMGGEYMLRQPARMALEQAYGRSFMDHLNQADSWLGSGSRGTAASQAKQAGVNTGRQAMPFPSMQYYASGGQIVSEAERFIGAPYVYGGTTPSGWDCSGFVQYVLEQLGWHNVPRTSEQQYSWAAKTSNPAPGGLVFAQFPGDNASPGHVGFYVGNGQVLSARDPAEGTGIDSLSSWSGHIVGYGSEPNATGLIGQIVNTVTGAITELWQSAEGLLDSAGTGLGDLVKPLSGMVSGGAGALLKLAKQGAGAIFNGVWDHAVTPLLGLMPGDSIPGAITQGSAGEIKAAIDNFMTGQDASAKTAAASAGSGGGSIGPVSGPADEGPAQAMAYAQSRLSAYGWGGDQFPPLKFLWNKESGWSRFARNSDGGAYGIPQALPPTKLPAAGQAGGGSHASPQIDWGLGYIKGTPGYGSPAAAWAHEEAHDWYAAGGPVHPSLFMASGGPVISAIKSAASDNRVREALALASYLDTGWDSAYAKGGRYGAFALPTSSGVTQADLKNPTWAVHHVLPAYQRGVQWVYPSYWKEKSDEYGVELAAGHAEDRYVRSSASQWQAVLSALGIGAKPAPSKTTTPKPTGSTPVPKPTGNAFADWATYQALLTGKARSEMSTFWDLMGTKLPAKGPTMDQRYAWTSWQEALEKQQLKTVGLGRKPPGALAVVSEGLADPSTLTSAQWSALTSDVGTLLKWEEGPGDGGVNPPGSRKNSGYPAWKFEHAKWAALRSGIQQLQTVATDAAKAWTSSYGPSGPPATPGTGTTTPGTGSSPGGAGGISVNLGPVTSMGGPAVPVYGPAPDMGFAAGGGLDDVASMFSPGVLSPSYRPGGIPDVLLRRLTAAQGGPPESPRRLSEAGAAHSRVGLNVENLTIHNPQPASSEASIARAGNRLAFLAGRGA